MKTYSATALTLFARKFRDAGRVVTFYTREQGKLEAVASGIGKPGSSLAGAVEPFTVSRLFLAAGRDLDRLTQAQVVEAFPQIAHDLTAYGYASWMAELTARATEPGEACPELFDLLCASLRALATGTSGPLLASAYALALLEILGFAPVLDACVSCGADLPGAACYNTAAGGLMCPDCGPAAAELMLRPGTRGVLQGLRRLPPERLRSLGAREVEIREVFGLLRRHLAFHLNLKLKSEEFLQDLTRPEDAPPS